MIENQGANGEQNGMSPEERAEMEVVQPMIVIGRNAAGSVRMNVFSQMSPASAVVLLDLMRQDIIDSFRGKFDRKGQIQIVPAAAASRLKERG